MTKTTRPFYVQPFAAFFAFVLALPSPAPAQSPLPQNPPVDLVQRLQKNAAARPSAAAISDGLLPIASAPQADALTAKATTPANCIYQGGSYIIQYVCTGNRLGGSTPPDSGLISALQQFESDSIKQWLALFDLPNADSDVTFFYQTARTPTRNSVRAMMLLRMVDIALRVRKSTNTVTANEKTAYGWFQGRVQARIVQMDQDAVNDKNSFQHDRCAWKPDPDLEKTYGFTYIPCVGTQIFHTAPNGDYFSAAALKKDFTQVLANLVQANAPLAHSVRATGFAPRTTGSGQQKTTSGATLFGGQSDSMAKLLGIIGGSTGGVLAVGGTVFGILATTVPTLRKAIFPNRNKGDYLSEQRANKVEKPEDIEEEVKDNAEDVETEASVEGDAVLESDAGSIAATADADEALLELGEIGAADADEIAESAAGGPIGLLIGVAIAVVTTIVSIIVDEAVAEQSLGALDSTLNSDSANAPDLLTLMSTSLGSYQIGVSWTEATWPEIASTADMPALRDTDPVVVTFPAGFPTVTRVNDFTYLDWGAASISPVAYGGMIIKNGTFHVPPSALKAGQPPVVTASDLNTTLEYLNWNGDPYWASRVGYGWVVGKRFPLSTDVDCPAGPSGVTEQSDLTHCSTYVADTLQIFDDNAIRQVLYIAAKPAINPASTQIEFNTIESPLTVTVPVLGFPSPTITVDNLPQGVVMNTQVGGTANFNFVLNGGSVPPGTYTTQVHARNSSGSTTTTFTFVVTGPDFAAPPTWDVHASDGNHQVWTSGVPITPVYFHVNSAYQVTWQSNIILPQGMTFLTTAGSNAIGITGTPSVNSIGSYKTTDNTTPFVEACDGQNRCVALAVFYQVNQAPSAHFTVTDYPIQLDFPVGQQRSYTLRTAGAITPVSFFFHDPAGCFGTPPSWVNLTDNGNGSMTLSGNAPSNNGIESVFLSNIVIHTVGAPDPPCQNNNFVFFQDSLPQIFDPPPTVTVGSGFGQFLHTNVTPGVGDVTLASPLPNGVNFSGPSQSGPWNFGGTPQQGSGGQYNLAFVMKPRSDVNPVTQNFLLTVNESPYWSQPFVVVPMMSGVNNQYVLHPGGFPTYNNMSISKGPGALPQGVIYSTGTKVNPKTGTAIVKGNPAASTIGQDFPFTVTANNGIGTPGTMTVILHILPPGDVTQDNKVDCSDVTLVKSHVGAKAGTAAYVGAADVNGDGVINVLDLAFVTSHLPQGTVCH